MSDHSYGVASQEPHKSTMAEHSYGAPSHQPQGFGDPGLFGTFNTQDVLTAPASEMDDPLILEDLSDIISSDIHIKEELPRQLNTPEQCGEGVTVKTEQDDMISEVMQCDNDGAPILQHYPPNVAAAPGLRIAGFAVDPDSLCVLPQTQPQPDNIQQPQQHQQTVQQAFNPNSSTTQSSTMVVRQIASQRPGSALYQLMQPTNQQVQPAATNADGQGGEVFQGNGGFTAGGGFSHFPQTQTVHHHPLTQTVHHHPTPSQQSQQRVVVTSQPIYQQATTSNYHQQQQPAASLPQASGQPSFSPSILSFLYASLQEEKIYSIDQHQINSLGKPCLLRKRYFIFTSSEISRHDARAIRHYKLFIPASYTSMKDTLLANNVNLRISGPIRGAVNQSQDCQTYRLHFTNGANAEFEIPLVLGAFVKAVAAGHNILIWQENVDRFAAQTSGWKLFPSFFYEKVGEFQKIEIPANHSRLGYEGTPITPLDVGRKKHVQLVCDEVSKFWTLDSLDNDGAIKKRIMSCAVLLEDHVYQEASKVPNFLNSSQHQQVILKMKDCFLVKRKEYAGLRNYPDIMYQLMVTQGVVGLRIGQNLNSLTVTTKNLSLANSMAEPRMTNLAEPRMTNQQPKVDPLAIPASQCSVIVNPGVIPSIVTKTLQPAGTSPILNSMLDDRVKSESILGSMLQEPVSTDTSLPQLGAVFSIAPSSKAAARMSYFYCPFYGVKCTNGNPYQDITNLLRHLNQAHFMLLLETRLSKSQAEQPSSHPALGCPRQPCGFIAPTTADLVWHYSRCSALTAILLKASAEKLGLTRYASMAHLPQLQPFPVQVDPVNCAQCPQCRVTVQLQHKQCHQALVHFKDKYELEIQKKRVTTGKPAGTCPWIRCLFSAPQTSELGRDVSLIKHVVLEHLPIKSLVVDNRIAKPGPGGAQNIQNGLAMTWMPPNVHNSLHELKVKNQPPKKKGPNPRIICRTCNFQFALLTSGGVEVRQISDSKTGGDSSKERKKCKDCRLSKVDPEFGLSRLVCKLCDKKVLMSGALTTAGTGNSIAQNLSKHLTDHMACEDHRQREIIFNYYLEYARIKGFDWEKDVKEKNLKFFLNVLQAKALHEKITQICSVSVLTNSLQISPSTYSSMYRHLDNLIRQQASNFACFLCNWVSVSWKEVQEHLVTAQHTEQQAVWAARLQNTLLPREAILCGSCDVLIDDESVEKHKDHQLPETEKPVALKSPGKRKKKIEEEEEADIEEDMYLEDIDEKMTEEARKRKRSEEEEWVAPEAKEEEEFEELDDEEYELEFSDKSMISPTKENLDIDMNEYIFKPKPMGPKGRIRARPLSSSDEESPHKAGSSTAAVESVSQTEEGLQDLQRLMDQERGERQKSPLKRIKLEKTNKETFDAETAETVGDYFYFCLDCEALEDPDDPVKTRFPLSIDLASHITTTNHQNFAPIKGRVGVRLESISFSQEHNKTVIKKWKRLVKDGDIGAINALKYPAPKKCSKCDERFGDAIDMFKHIKETHIDPDDKVNTTGCSEVPLKLEQKELDLPTQSSSLVHGVHGVQCTKCTQVFPTRHGLGTHMMAAHNCRYSDKDQGIVLSLKEAQDDARQNKPQEGPKNIVQEKLDDFILSKISLSLSGQHWKCSECDYTRRDKRNVLNHFEAKHMPTVEFQCTECPQIYSTRHGLGCHMVQHGLRYSDRLVDPTKPF